MKSAAANCDCDQMPEAKRRLLEAAVKLMMQQGFSATTVDQVCTTAGLTKGSFFHYFKSKDQIGEAVVDYYTACQKDSITKAEFYRIEDPLERLNGMLDFFIARAKNPDFPQSCLVGNLAQEMSATNPGIRSCCEASFSRLSGVFAELLKQAKASRPVAVEFDPASVADMMLSLLHGSILVAKTRKDCSVVAANLTHCRAYVQSLFAPANGKPKKPKGAKA